MPSAALHVVETGFTVDSIASALRISTRVQVGCNKTSDRLLRAPKLAIGAVNFHSVTAEASATQQPPNLSALKLGARKLSAASRSRRALRSAVGYESTAESTSGSARFVRRECVGFGLLG